MTHRNGNGGGKEIGGVALTIAALLFMAFFANVMMGAAGIGSPLTGASEMLVLLASVVAFVVGILSREARAVAKPDGPDK